MHVGFVGLGHMGAAIARNLAEAGHEVVAWNRSPVQAPQGVRLVSALADTLRGEVLISMLADDRAVTAALVASGAIARLGAGQAHINMATISAALGQTLQAEHARCGSRYVSAPVFGRPEAAAAKKLFIVAGGDRATIESAQPLFEATAQRTYNVGEQAHHANLIKLCGNLLVAMAVEGLAETVNLARKSGIDPRLMVDILSGSIFAVPVYQVYGRLIAEKRYEPAHFKVPLGLKDVELALEAGNAAGARLPSAELIRGHLLAALERNLGEKDWSVLGEILDASLIQDG
jgi:3-hydroxyisobutyrate dehydrogenase-like beta-hydroxyacid dehydrogenase